MESNWRWNVFVLAASFTGLRLVARDLRDANTYVTDDTNTPAGSYRQWRDPLGIGFIVPDVSALKPDPDANFPYGVAVEPDTPM